MLVLPNGNPISLADLYRGRSAFLVCGGPSLASHDLTQLQRRGILTMAVNNAATVVRPQLWTCVDDPGNFCDAIWRDPAIVKFAPAAHFEKPLLARDSQGQLVHSADRVRDMPAVFGYNRNEDFVAERFLREETFNWGNHGKRGDADGQRGSRSVMYAALKLLFYLGVRRVYLLGCDFRMEYGTKNYAFDQNRTPSSIKGNNRSYDVLNVRLGRLRPYFEKEGFQVLNCTPSSGLTVFPSVAFQDAVQTALEGFPQQLITAGMYDRVQRERDAAKAAGVQQREVPSILAASSACSTSGQADEAGMAGSAACASALQAKGGGSQPLAVYDYMDKAFVINLASRPDRLAHITAQCARAGISFQRFEAIRPQERGNFLTPGARGCFLSHMAIWRAALEAKHERILILEDDVVFQDDFCDLFPGIIAELRLVEWDLFYGAARRRSRRGSLRVVRRLFNSHFYIAKPSGLKYLLENATEPFAKGTPVDIYAGATPLVKLVPPTNIAEQAAGRSDISGRVSRRHRVVVGSLN